MKRIILTFLLAFFVNAYGQNIFSKVRFGLTAGVNRSGVGSAHRPSGPRYSFQAGAFALVPLGQSSNFFLQPELLFHGAGETGRDKDFKDANINTNGYNALYANNYISVPVYLKIYFLNAPSRFFAMVGPRFNFLISQNVKNVPVGRPYYDPNYSGTSPYNGKASSFNFAIGLGIGYSFRKDWEIILKHDIGITNTYKGLMKELSPRNKSEQVISLGANYIFK
ncbi:porin family protein [Elizabethkingia miricola]|uniref:porin family protein n=1 Tax=Elizabethkingia miricola TaxID=172045 RepID=UPI002ACE8FCC|nr:porin family protein [Elizabethkingia miricola]WQM39438.1 porin family protein [Elizabethkingia miricola]